MQYKKKLTDMFLRKQNAHKKQIVLQKPKVLQFDESYFESQLVYQQFETSLIKVNATIKKGINKGQQIPLKCKWYIKNQVDFKQVKENVTSCFQPTLDDINNIICVQIQPYIEGMIYTGITIMKQTGIIKIDKKIQSIANDYFVNKYLQIQGKIQNIYSQNPKYQFLELPIEVLIILKQNIISLTDKNTKQDIGSYLITQEYPQIEFNRKSYNSILFNCNQNQSMKISLTNNFNRDLFALIIRSIPNRLKLKSQQQILLQVEPQIQSQKQINSQVNSQEITKLILKIDQLNKQLKNQKRLNQQIMNNYHLERNAKINLLNQIQKIKNQYHKVIDQHAECKPLHIKIKQVTDQNRFYFGQISLIKNQLNQKNSIIKQLKKQIRSISSLKQQDECNIKKLTQQPKVKIQQLQKQLIDTKLLYEQSQAQCQVLKQKIIQLENSTNVLKKKLSSIVSQKSLPNSPTKSQQIKSVEDLSENNQVKKLKMQIINLEMLLKHKASQKGGQNIGMHLLVNNLTQKIQQKQMEIDALRKINKQISKRRN